MIALILFIIFGLLFGYFATLNTSLVSLHFGIYSIDSVPVYLLVLVSLGVGTLFASVFYFLKSIGSAFALNKKEGEIRNEKKEIAELTKELHKLEIENTKLKTKNGGESEDEDSL